MNIQQTAKRIGELQLFFRTIVMGSSSHHKLICSTYTPFLSMLFCLVFLSEICLSAQNGSSSCLETERAALAAFKESLVDPSERLSSWVGVECCSWTGITCDDQTGLVTRINLTNRFRSRDAVFDPNADKSTCLGGKISSSLLQLKSLSHLDLSLNDFEGIPIPKFLGELKTLTYLNLASASFSGEIPSELGNLTNLQHLDLYCYASSQDFLRAESLQWLTDLTSLKYLNLGFVVLYNVASDWLQSINMLPSLLELHVPGCDMEKSTLDLNNTSVNFTSLVTLNMSSNFFKGSVPPWLSNLTSLEVLDLSLNYLVGPFPKFSSSSYNLQTLDLSTNELGVELAEVLLGLGKLKDNLQYLNLDSSNISGSIPSSIGDFSSLTTLDLSGNFLSGPIPTSIGSLSSLKKLDFSGNNLSGSIPYSISNMQSLEYLDLSVNAMDGTIPESIGQLSQLSELHLDSNKWRGILTEAHLMNLTRLQKLTLTTDLPMSLVFNITYDWIPPFKLTYLDIENCLVGPAFSVWLQSQRSLAHVVLQNAGISDTIPEDWFSGVASQLVYLDLSKNIFRGKLPHQLVFPSLSIIDLSSNNFEGQFPAWSTNATSLNLQRNQFSGPVAENIGELMPSLSGLDLSWNIFSSSIPSSICRLKNLALVILRNNNFSGNIPDCWEGNDNLWALDVSNNKLSGSLPASIGNLKGLHALLLHNNSLHGEIPKSLQNCSSIMMLDLGENKFSGSLPTWIGESLSSLLILVLSDNSFSGRIPLDLCKLEYVHFLDLSWNNFSGTVPKCFSNFTALINGSYDIFHDVQKYYGIYYDGQLIVTTKGNEYEYRKTATLINGIDLSGNNLSGRIPDEITSLSLTAILNLSMNHLSGSIPQSIGEMKQLETLDLSYNQLSGAIPPTLSSLTFLSHLNLSFNNLEGRIPSGSQLGTLNDPSIYEGNPQLCGVPLPNRCLGDHETTPVDVHQEDSNHKEDVLFYLTIVMGFIVGFWGVCGTLVLKKSWRHAYFKFLDDVKSKIGA